MRNDATWHSISSACPGAWYGNRPEGLRRGHITVNPILLTEAVTYLADSATLRVGATRPSPREGIQISLFDRQAHNAATAAKRRARTALMAGLGMHRVRGGWE